MPIGREHHEKQLKKYKEELEEEGWRVILLQGKSPDGRPQEKEKKTTDNIAEIIKTIEEE